MDNEMEMLIMNLVVDSGSGRSYAIEAIQYAKEGEFDKAEEALENAEAELVKAHAVQSDLIRKEISGEGVEINLMMVHSQDHLMTAMLCKDLAKEMVELYRRI